MNQIRDLFLLDPEIVFLNHGSFGACPRPVFETYQSWQLELERQPVEFLGRKAAELCEVARTRLATYVSAPADDIVFFPNPTTAINMVVRNLKLSPGDEILTSDHEYGAMDRTWRFFCRQTGAKYIQRSIPLPLVSCDDFVESFWQGVNSRTRVIFLSHITSPTALIFPIEAICQRARKAGILTIIDGAHAPGQIELNLKTLEADIYTGACHKWLMAPKGAAFLYARPEVQSWLMPLVVSWGYEAEHPGKSQFVDYHEWQGTRELAAFLSVPAAIAFQEKYDWKQVRIECHKLAVNTRHRISELTGCEPLCAETDISAREYTWFNQMFTARLPDWIETTQFKERLFAEFRVEAPIINWNDQKYIRISIQGYNTPADGDVLLDAMRVLLKR